MKTTDLTERLEQVNVRVKALNIELSTLNEEAAALIHLIKIYNKRTYDPISEERKVTENIIRTYIGCCGTEQSVTILTQPNTTVMDYCDGDIEATKTIYDQIREQQTVPITEENITKVIEESESNTTTHITYDESMSILRKLYKIEAITTGCVSLTKRRIGELSGWGSGKVDRIFTRAEKFGDIVLVEGSKPMRYEIVKRFGV